MGCPAARRVVARVRCFRKEVQRGEFPVAHLCAGKHPEQSEKSNENTQVSKFVLCVVSEHELLLCPPVCTCLHLSALSASARIHLLQLFSPEVLGLSRPCGCGSLFVSQSGMRKSR